MSDTEIMCPECGRETWDEDGHIAPHHRPSHGICPASGAPVFSAPCETCNGSRIVGRVRGGHFAEACGACGGAGYTAERCSGPAVEW